VKVLFDLLGSSERSGGMRLHATELVSAWLDEFPDDEITLVAPPWAKAVFNESVGDIRVWPNESPLTRALGQVLTTAAASWVARPDVVVSLSPIVSPLIPSAKAVCFQHDWRHKRNPHEFSRIQRAYRKLWEVSAGRSLNVCISQKASRETQQYVNGARTAVVENGWDHARGWTRRHTQDSRQVTTFGHHNNKRPDLVIRAVASAIRTTESPIELVVLGARGREADQLRQLAESLGIGAQVSLPGFVSDAEYQAAISDAGVVVLASTDEGFGLPVAEAQYLGIPAVVTSDSGMHEIFGDSVIVAEPTPGALGAQITHALASQHHIDKRPMLRTWKMTALELRSLIASHSVRRDADV